MTLRSVPSRLQDKHEIRQWLNLDREWALYALADLDEPLFHQCDWWAHGDALILVFKGLGIRPILVMGGAECAAELLAGLPESTGYLNIKPELLEITMRGWSYRERNEMRRMVLDRFTPKSSITEPLTIVNREEIEALYRSGQGGGIAFADYQLATGYFRGIRHQGALISVAGVHVVSQNESVAGVGNIFTRSDFRGRGLAQSVTSAVVSTLVEAGIRTIGLNVEYTNAAAIRAYETIGFRTRFHYYEGVADRRSS